MSEVWPDAPAIRAARSAKPVRDAWAPLGHRWDVERGLRVPEREVLTVFLTGAECPFTCLFCDLWQYTLPESTPEGALPDQLAGALVEAGGAPGQAAVPAAIKLYNASNFFDRRAVPPGDLGLLAEACSGFDRTTVESHPKLLGERCEAFSDALAGRLEIAMGLETIHPVVFPRLKDGMTLDGFDEAVRWARDRSIGVRAFVLVGLPWVQAREFASWAARSAAHALEVGADRVSLIPLREDGGVLADLSDRGDLAAVSLSHLEQSLDAAFEARGSGVGIIEADLWDAERFAECALCAAARIDRLRQMNLSQRGLPAISCGCSGS